MLRTEMELIFQQLNNAPTDLQYLEIFTVQKRRLCSLKMNLLLRAANLWQMS